MSVDSFSKRKRLFIFSIIFVATAGIEFFLIMSLLQQDESLAVTKPEKTIIKQASVSPVHYDMASAGNELLATRLSAIQQLDRQYADLITATKDKKRLDSVSNLIDAQEAGFKKAIDSISLNSQGQADSGSNKLFNNIVSSYKSILQNRSSIRSLRNAVNVGETDSKPDEMALLRTQNTLQEKDDRIAVLENELKVLSAKKMPPGGENVAALKETLTERENRITALTQITANLKQENEKLLKQLNDGNKAASPGDLASRNKIISQQQRIDELNAELRLAHVDCNISRVDAGQIVSNSRQKKELLSEASGILTSLSKSDDADIRKKVQEKIIRLNQVAANTRD
jgi:hypothetical protein